jgi:PKD repeat protein
MTAVSGGALTSYDNGAAIDQANLSVGSLKNTADPLRFGSDKGGNYYDGTIFFAAISSVARSPAWIAATNDGLTDTLITYEFDVPTPNFTTDKTEIFRGGAVQFTDTSGFEPTAWNWSFGDGTFSNEQHPVHTFTIPGNYTVLLNASNQYGSATYYRPACVRVKDVDFIANATIGTASMAVAFTDTSGPGVTGWQWNFGDGQTSSGQNPVHTYTAPGDYTVTLTATTPNDTVVAEKIGYVNVRDTYTALTGYDHKFLLRINAVPETLEDVPVKIVLGDTSGTNALNT